MEIEKITRTRFRSGHVQESRIDLPPALSIGMPDGVKDVGGGVWVRVTLRETSEVYEIWQPKGIQ